jgi:hypothetical protein
MSSPSPVAPSSHCRRGTVGPRVKITRDRSGLLSVLAAIDDVGWDSVVGESLLVYVRATVVRPHLVHTGLCDAAREQAEATAWEAVWEALLDESLRTAESPWGVLWQVARHAVLGEIIAGEYGTDVRKSWRARRRSALKNSESSLRSASDSGAALISLEDLPDGGTEIANDDGLLSLEACPLLMLVVDALVEVGWTRSAAARVVESVACSAGRVGSDAVDWRLFATALRIPGWQVRRAAVAVLGVPGWPGLVQRLATDGPAILELAGVQAAMRSTVTSWMPSTVTAANQAASSPIPSQAA